MINIDKVYKLPFWLNILYRGSAIVIFYLMCVFIVGAVYIFFDTLLSLDIQDIFLFIWFIAMSIFGLLFSIPLNIDYFAPIRLDEGGVYIKTFFFISQWHFIPWDEIKEIKRPLTVLGNQGKKWVVRVSEMKIFYKHVGRRYRRQGLYPCFAIHPWLKDSEELVEIIKERISKNREL
jgi:hypothetical protein